MSKVRRESVLTKGELIELQIERLSQGGGRGVGKFKGMVVFTPFVLPKETVRVRVTKIQKKYVEAELIEVLQSSDHRRSPECEVFGDCGGCSLQMASYDLQVKEKTGFVEHALKRLGVSLENLEGLERASNEYRYRNRIQVQQQGNDIGYFKKKTHKLVKINDCVITDNRIVEKFKDLKTESKTRRVEISLTKKKEVRFTEGRLGPEDLLFSQINIEMNEKLISHVLKKARLLSFIDNIYDLYCGAGNFSFPLAQVFPDKKVLGVELSKASMKQAEKVNALKNLSFRAQDIKDFFKGKEGRVRESKENKDFVLLDPPRSGLSEEVLEALLGGSPKFIFYISCNLSVATRDLKRLLETYEVKSVKPFDMFPQTDHLEVFFELELK